jgi:hypothetical protein
MLVALVIMLTFAVDVGYLCIARGELQRSADAAAIAGAWELIDSGALTRSSNPTQLQTNVRNIAGQYAGLNSVLRASPQLCTDDVVVGRIDNLDEGGGELDTSGASPPNAVRVRVQRTANQNGEVPMFLARIMGLDSAAAEAEATAVLVTSFSGFQTPANGGNLDIVPLALDLNTWNGLLAGVGTDNWRYDAGTNRVVAGSDNVLEVNLYPQGTGSPGNRGTVDIGSSNNSTADIARQILHGVSPSDLAHHGGKLELDADGELELNGDTGISAGVKDELASIIGKKRIVPIFQSVVGPGNNATYTIVQFAGIRIMEVRLTGAASSKRVMIQPANCVAHGAIPSSAANTSSFVYSPVWLLR